MSQQFLVDSETLRERARRYASRLEWDRERFHADPPPESEYRWARRMNREDEEYGAGVFSVPTPDGYVEPVSRTNSVQRREARFRDGLPPPPPPRLRYDATSANPRQAQLLDQEALNRGVRVRESVLPQASPQYPQVNPPPPIQYGPPPGYVMTADGQFLPDPRFAPQAQVAPPADPYPTVSPHAPSQNGPQPRLSTSQKKRLRRKRARTPIEQAIDTAQVEREIVRGVERGLPAPTPNGVYPTHPAATPQPYECPAEVIAQHPRASALRLKCEIHPWPHPGQPHMMKLGHDDPAMSIFVGWWMPGE